MINNLSRKLQTGVGAEVKHTSVISPEEENAPQLGILSNCTININYGSNKVKIYHQSYKSDSSDDFVRSKNQLLNMDF